MVRKRTYGAKKSSVSKATAAIFGCSAKSPAIESAVVKSSSPSRPALTDITLAIANLRVDDTEDGNYDSDEERTLAVQHRKELELESESNEDEGEEDDDSESDSSSNDSSSSGSTDGLDMITRAYYTDRKQVLLSQSWSDLLTEESSIFKIAEASYAEVYRITNGEQTSIVKILRLQDPAWGSSDPDPTAIKPEHVVSEMRIMNAMAEIPGFVVFKDAHFIKGKASKKIEAAYEAREAAGGPKSLFPHPKEYTENSLFLAIELGDAGEPLEYLTIQNTDQIWDVFLGVVMALARGESEAEFEHRDLHENNICIAAVRSPSKHNPATPNVKFGYSRLETTLIDYGLSRCTLPNNEVISYDLEEDLSVFQGSDGHLQFNAYRRMRTHLFTSTHSLHPASWHDESSKSQNNNYTWQEYRPYNNVIWLNYLLSYLKKSFKKTGLPSVAPLKVFNEETRELTRRLDFRTKKGAFESAVEVLEFVVGMGWITCEQAGVSAD